MTPIIPNSINFSQNSPNNPRQTVTPASTNPHYSVPYNTPHQAETIHRLYEMAQVSILDKVHRFEVTSNYFIKDIEQSKSLPDTLHFHFKGYQLLHQQIDQQSDQYRDYSTTAFCHMQKTRVDSSLNQLFERIRALAADYISSRNLRPAFELYSTVYQITRLPQDQQALEDTRSRLVLLQLAESSSLEAKRRAVTQQIRASLSNGFCVTPSPFKHKPHLYLIPSSSSFTLKELNGVINLKIHLENPEKSDQIKTYFLEEGKHSIFVSECDLLDLIHFLKQEKEWICAEKNIEALEIAIQELKEKMSLSNDFLHKLSTVMEWLKHSIQKAIPDFNLSWEALLENMPQALFDPYNPLALNSHTFLSRRIFQYLIQLDLTFIYYEGMPQIPESLKMIILNLKKPQQDNIGIIKSSWESFRDVFTYKLAQRTGCENILVCPSLNYRYFHRETLGNILDNSPKDNKLLMITEQPYLQDAIFLHTLRSDYATNSPHWNSIIKKIDIRSYQQAAIFGLVSKQNDWHAENGALILSPKGFYQFCFVDSGRCATPDGASFIQPKKNTPDDLFFYLRSVLMHFPQFEQPLTHETIQWILSWNIEEILNVFIPVNNYQRTLKKMCKQTKKALSTFNESTQTQEDAPLFKRFNAAYQRSEELLSYAIDQSALHSLRNRYLQLQILVREYYNRNEPLTMHSCYQYIFPIEMRIVHLYDHVYGKEHTFRHFCTFNEALKEAVSQKIMPSETAKEWLRWINQLIQKKILPIIPFSY